MVIHRLVLAIILSVMLAEHFVLMFGAPAVLKFIPELLTVVTSVVVIVHGIQNQFRYLAGQYWLVFAFVILIIVSGIISNHVGTGPTIAGMRYYFRAIPFFLLPAVVDFSDQQLKRQFGLLLSLALLQNPIALYQRWQVSQGPGHWSGDEVFGTMQISSILSIFLIGVVLVIVAFHLRDRLGKWSALLLSLFLLIPTTINETKGTVILLPVGLFVVLMVGVRPGQRLKVAAWSGVLLICFSAIFVPVYDYLNKDRPYAVSITEFFLETENLERYMQKDSAGVGTKDEAGRVDAIRVPFEYLARDPVKILFGLGLGNASHSQIAQGFTGDYFYLFEKVAISSASVFLLEIGFLGASAVFLLYFLIFRDALFVARHDQGLRGSFAIGWAGIIVVMGFATFYKPIHTFESLSYLFWYLSGLVVATRMRLSS